MTASSTIDADTRRRMVVYPRLILAAMGLAFVIVIAAGSGSDTATGRVGGDFPAFYSAGSIVADGAIDQLYDQATQAEAQAELLGTEDGYIMYPYAPHVAASYVPLSQLPYRAAYVVHTFIMVAALVGALWLMRPMVGVVDRWFSLSAAAALTAYPVFVGTNGGQNTAFTLLLLAGIWRCLHDDRELAVGVLVGVLAYRPQYALPLLGLLFLGRYWRALVSASAVLSAVWIVNATLFGAGWISRWLSAVTPLLEADAEINGLNEIAPIGALQSLLGVESVAALVVGGTISVAVILTLSALWWRSSFDLDTRVVVTFAGLGLVGPHAIYYDTSLLLFATLWFFDRGRIDRRVLVAIWILGLTHLGKNAMGFTPLALVALAGFAASLTLAIQTTRDRVLPTHDS